MPSRSGRQAGVAFYAFVAFQVTLKTHKDRPGTTDLPWSFRRKE